MEKREKPKSSPIPPFQAKREISLSAPSLFGLYIHYPYCLSKCPYCDFASLVCTGLSDDILLKAYARDIDLFLHHFEQNEKSPPPLTSIFFGGGTPSLMHEKMLEKLLSRITQKFNLAPNIEITLEANPDAIDLDKMKTLKRLGINRLSMGVQSMTDAGLQQLGRRHTLTTALDRISEARTVFDNINIDFIYARPGQTVHEWETELSAALALDLPHYSFYQLTVEEGTPFYNQNVQPASDDIAREMYILTKQMVENFPFPLSPNFPHCHPDQSDNLSAPRQRNQCGKLKRRGGISNHAAGIQNTNRRNQTKILQYEVSNYAKPGFECTHNLCYWRGNDYIGIGPAAHGRLTLSSSYHRHPEALAEGSGNSKNTLTSSVIANKEKLSLKESPHSCNRHCEEHLNDEAIQTRRIQKQITQETNNETFFATSNARSPLDWIKTPPTIETLTPSERFLEKTLMHLRLTREPTSTAGLSPFGIRQALKNGWIELIPASFQTGRAATALDLESILTNESELKKCAILPTTAGTLMLNQLILLLTE